MDTSYLLFGLLLFLAVVLGLEGAYHLWAARHSAEARRLASRIRNLEGTIEAAAPLSIERRSEAGRWDWLDDGVLARLPSGARLHAFVQSAGTGRGTGELMMMSGALAVAGVTGALLLELPAAFMVLGALLAVLPWAWVARRRSQRLQLLERQLPEALDLMGRALRAGHALPTAVKMVGEEMAEPIAREFRQLFDETNFGMPQHEALLRLADRVPLDDLRYFVIAVMIQRDSGGNLAELLDNVAAIVRARLKLLGQVRTLSAEGRLSAWILGLLPFCVAALINIVNPEFMKVLWTDPVGLKMVGGALVLMALGVWWMRKIIRIRV